MSQDQTRVEVFSRSVGWERRAATNGESVVLTSLGVTLDVDELYFNPLADH